MVLGLVGADRRLDGDALQEARLGCSQSCKDRRWCGACTFVSKPEAHSQNFCGIDPIRRPRNRELAGVFESSKDVASSQSVKDRSGHFNIESELIGHILSFYWGPTVEACGGFFDHTQQDCRFNQSWNAFTDGKYGRRSASKHLEY